MREQAVDILIVGGGIVGAAMMQVLAPLGLRVLLVDAAPPPVLTSDNDARCLTLSYSSIQILTQCGLWPALSPHTTRIDSIHVSERGAFGRACLRGEADRPLGVVIPIAQLRYTLCPATTRDNYWYSSRLVAFDLATHTASIQTPAAHIQVRAALVIAADGVGSPMRHYCGLTTTVKDYAQRALVANITLARAHQHCAYERFTDSGLIALLPQPGLRAGLVWVGEPEEITQLQSQQDTQFLQQLQGTFGYRLGRLMAVGRREVYPLRQVLMPQQVKDQVVFIGNAAHTIHPVAGQGFNLGLRDVAMLAQCIAQQGISTEALETYQQLRKRDQQAIIDLTDGLSALYGNRWQAVRIARQLGLMAFDNTQTLKKLVSRYASGLGGIVPDLVCGLPLRTDCNSL
jgi:2-octaprenyl-6-methoxyphenol hydroxylase